MDPISAIALAVTGVFAYRIINRGQRNEGWKHAVDEAAKKLGGRASLGGSGNAPELRATVDQILVNVRLDRIHRSRAQGVAIAEARVSDRAGKVRLYVGWDIGHTKNEIAHIPEIPVVQPFGVKGRITLRSDHPALARRFLRHALNDLTDVRREAAASALEIKLTGGTLRLAVHGIQQSSWMIERIVTATTRLVRGLDYFTGSGEALEDAGLPASSPATPPTEAFEAADCEVCASARKAREQWVRCDRCDAAYHRRCWVQATGCLAGDCQETRATPI